MALEKVITQDKIEVVGEYRAVQVRTKTAVMEDGVVIAGDDYSGESAEVRAICAAVHTDAVIAAQAAANQPPE